MTGGLGAPAGDRGDHRAGGCPCGSPPFGGRLSSEGDTGSGVWGLEWTPEAQSGLGACLLGWRVQAGPPGAGWGSGAAPAVTCSSQRGRDDSEPAPRPEALSAAQPSRELTRLLLSVAPASSTEGLFLEGLLLLTLGRGAQRTQFQSVSVRARRREGNPGARLAAGIWHVGSSTSAGRPERRGLRGQERGAGLSGWNIGGTA